MALTNYERQKRWREKHRATYNLRRRNKRKNLSGGDVVQTTDHGRSLLEKKAVTSSPPSKIDELRELIKTESEKPSEPVTKPVIYRNDYGQVITEGQWKMLQKRKQEAKDGGYVLDEYTQV